MPGSRRRRRCRRRCPICRRVHAGETFVMLNTAGMPWAMRRWRASSPPTSCCSKQVGIQPDRRAWRRAADVQKMLERLKIQSSFIDGLRVTDSATVEIVEMVLSGSINKQDRVGDQRRRRCGGRHFLGQGRARLIEARKLRRTVRDPDSNIEKILDLGFVGEPVRINPVIMQEFAESDIISGHRPHRHR